MSQSLPYHWPVLLIGLTENAEREYNDHMAWPAAGCAWWWYLLEEGSQ